MSGPLLPSLDSLDPALAWSVWEPSAGQPWDARRAAHLWRRFGFGPTGRELNTAVAEGMPATVERLFALPAEPTPRPRCVDGPPPLNPATGLPDSSAQVMTLRAAWIRRMLDGVEPAREKLALFWHNHFATSVRKVVDAGLMERQGELLFTHALGSFRTLLGEISRDPAMLIWLDSTVNRKGKPNENFAREVMELFTLGVGRYTETDIREAARALTGSSLRDGKYWFDQTGHDAGPKVIFGKSGAWTGDDLPRLLLDRPECATYLVRKMYREFVSETDDPPDALLKPLADAFRKADYDIRVPAMMIARSRHFYSGYAYRQKIKSPVEYVIGTSRLVGVGVTGRVIMNPYSLLGALELMGQSLYNPPNVKGWEGGKSWLGASAVLARHNFANALVNGGGELNDHARKHNPRDFYPVANPPALALRAGLTEPEATVRYFADLLLPGDFRREVGERLIAHLTATDRATGAGQQKCRDAIYVLLTLPEYQLN